MSDDVAGEGVAPNAVEAPAAAAPAPDPGEIAIPASNGAGVVAVPELVIESAPVAEPVVAETPVVEVPEVEAVPSTDEVPASPVPQVEQTIEPAAAQQPPASASAPAPAASVSALTVSSILALGLEKIRFRKRAKLEKIIILAKEKGIITNDDVQLALQVSDSTSTRYLSQLVLAGRLLRSGTTSQITYTAV